MKTTFGRVDSLAERLVDKAKKISGTKMSNLASDNAAVKPLMHTSKILPPYESVFNVPTTIDD